MELAQFTTDYIAQLDAARAHARTFTTTTGPDTNFVTLLYIAYI